jgi:hypothetical protein
MIVNSVDFQFISVHCIDNSAENGKNSVQKPGQPVNFSICSPTLQKFKHPPNRPTKKLPENQLSDSVNGDRHHSSYLYIANHVFGDRHQQRHQHRITINLA